MKFIPYGRQFLDKHDIKEVIAALKTNWITQGQKIKEFEDALCNYTGAKYAVVVSSGTAALHLAMLVAGIKSGDEVITSPITFVASTNCVLYCQGKPVFADIENDNANISIDEIKKKVSEKTKAIIPVHFAGHPVELKPICDIARQHNLMVIEDAAHALGAEYNKVKIGSCQYSDMAIFSFHPVKHITTGEGGAILTNNSELYEKLLSLKTHGIIKNKARFKNFNPKTDGTWYYEMQMLGFNYRITDFQCALGLSQLGKLDGFLAKRKEIVALYERELSKIKNLVLPTEKSHVKSAWHIYCIRVKNKKLRKFVFNELRRNNIGVQIHYIPGYWHPYYQRIGYKKGLCPNAEEFYAHEITIPLYPSMTKKDAFFVVKALKKIFRYV